MKKHIQKTHRLITSFFGALTKQALFLLALFAIVTVLVVYAADFNKAGYKVVNGGSTTYAILDQAGTTAINTSVANITEHGTCKKVTNNCGADIFVPTKSTGEWTGVAGFITKKPACATVDNCDCALPRGGTIAEGASVTAYQSANPYCSSCVSETRTCVNGQLNGTYTAQSCTRTPCNCNAGSYAYPFGSYYVYFNYSAFNHGTSQSLTNPNTACKSATMYCNDGSAYPTSASCKRGWAGGNTDRTFNTFYYYTSTNPCSTAETCPHASPDAYISCTPALENMYKYRVFGASIETAVRYSSRCHNEVRVNPSTLAPGWRDDGSAWN